jgi:prefoldin subunit 5
MDNWNNKYITVPDNEVIEPACFIRNDIVGNGMVIEKRKKKYDEKLEKIESKIEEIKKIDKKIDELKKIEEDKIENKPENKPESKPEDKPENKPEDINITQILTELKFISEIKPTNKLCHDNLNINIDKSYFPFLSRWWNKYNRNDTIDTLEKIYDNTISLLEILVKNQQNQILFIQKYKNIDLLQELIQHLDNSVDGLNSLKTTYGDDKHIVSRLDTLTKKITLQKQYANANIQFKAS